jgi:membrane-associated phospholipid phosphatase
MSARRTLGGILGLLLILAAIVAGVVLLTETPAAQAGLRLGLRAAIVALALTGWFLSQALISTRPTSATRIGDLLHDLTAPWHSYLLGHSHAANAVLIASSACIDLFGLLLVGLGIFGPSLRPFVALLILFMLRQLAQALCALPVPPQMIWRHPGFPSLLVTYGVANDFFFSGHTAIAVLGAIQIAQLFPWWLGLIAAAVALLEGAVVIVLRAHYTMDVFTGALAAWCAAEAAVWLCRLLGLG